ncbi:MAG: hypothetical protein ACRDTK_15785, partial [Mycobacterium sp.]
MGPAYGSSQIRWAGWGNVAALCRCDLDLTTGCVRVRALARGSRMLSLLILLDELARHHNRAC